MEDQYKLSGSVAIVTGGGQGLGLAFIQVLVENGGFVSLVDINEEVGIRATKELEQKYKAIGKVLFINCDVTKKEEFEDAFRKTIDKFGKINIVINNAGIMTKYMDEWERAIDLNYKAVVRGTLLGLKYIKNDINNSSAVINVGSITGLTNSILPMYQSTKRAVIEFTKSIGCSYNSKANNNNIRIMAICPGPTFDGFKDVDEKKQMLENKLKFYITNGEDNPDLNRKIMVQSTKYIQHAILCIMKNGKSGNIWIVENEEPPRLLNTSNQH